MLHATCSMCLCPVSHADAAGLSPIISAVLWSPQSRMSCIRGINDSLTNWFTPARTYVTSPKTTNFTYRHLDINSFKQTVVWQQEPNIIASQSIGDMFTWSAGSSSRLSVTVDNSINIVALATDWYTGNVYFLDSANKLIGVTTLNSGTNCYNVVVRKSIYNPLSIVVDSDAGSVIIPIIYIPTILK